MAFSSFLHTLTSAKLLVPNTLVRCLSQVNISESSLAFADSILILSLVLPSRQETCRFHLNLQTTTVGQLVDEIKSEDAGIEHVHIFDNNGQLLAKSYAIQSLMSSPFTIQLNKQRAFLFDPINKLQIKENLIRSNRTDGPSTEDTIGAVYNALNVMKVYHRKYHELKAEANELTTQLEPLEKVKDKLAQICQRHISRCVWYGLAGMSVQVGILAELTWDVYSWDIVEPMSYFLAFGTAIALYSFHLMTRADFEYTTMTDRIFLRKFYKEAQRHAFDISLYNRLKNRLFIVHTDLARLRAPLLLSLSVPPNPLKCSLGRVLEHNLLSLVVTRIHD
ncbi:unnamed protein product [Adineta ricciae]|uniref:Calcium uniporter protein n=1 Tax=Adineta ricciae TaxID=249248 RepID=A0A814B437_ADIRI|nr:unnamed protein product [Adineta ricciae]